MDSLARLFGSAARLKLLRLFLFNDAVAFDAADAAFRTKTSKAVARRELGVLAAADIIKKRPGPAYQANRRSPYFEPLMAFMRATTSVGDAAVAEAVKKSGGIRLIVLSGLFTGVAEAQVDLIVVGDRLDERAVAAAIHTIEAELGRELRYASFSTDDFRYRVGVYDRLLRDVFDYPHRIIFDRLGAVLAKQ